VEHIGYYLWEGSIFFTILVVGTSLLVLRRKANGRPAFTDHDRRLFFGHSEISFSEPRFYIHLGIAVFLCYLLAYLEYLLLARFGAGILAAAGLVTLLAIVKKWLG
jgi:hypothetical protein